MYCMYGSCDFVLFFKIFGQTQYSRTYAFHLHDECCACDASNQISNSADTTARVLHENEKRTKVQCQTILFCNVVHVCWIWTSNAASNRPVHCALRLFVGVLSKLKFHTREIYINVTLCTRAHHYRHQMSSSELKCVLSFFFGIESSRYEMQALLLDSLDTARKWWYSALRKLLYALR